MHKTKLIFESNDIAALKGTGITDKIDSLLNPQFRIGGYVSTYFAFYDDDSEPNGFVQFPTLAPRNDQFALNMALLNFSYESPFLRAAITLHYGDVPESSWPATFNLIQEARAGFRIIKNLWFDAGFFKTHIGLESFQPRENITSSMSIVDFYEPYYLAGMKLTYAFSPKFTLQAGMFNGYNEYIDNNKNKAIDFSLNYSPNRQFSFTYNFFTCDETPDTIKTKHQRFYNNLNFSYTYRKLTIGVELNYGLQNNSLKSDSSKTASMHSALIVAQFQVVKKLYVFGRLENYSDPNQILTASLNIGKYINGLTLGFEFKPMKTVGLSTEWRVLKSQNDIFTKNNVGLNKRDEFIVCLDLWF